MLRRRTAGAHGAERHNDITRSVYVDARIRMSSDGSADTTAGTVPDAIGIKTLTKSPPQGAYFNMLVPGDAKPASPINIVLYWAPSAGQAASAVRWSIVATQLAAGADIGTTGTLTDFTGDGGGKSLNIMIVEASTQILASATPGNLLKVSIRRLGGDALDTYSGTVRLIGARIDYTAVQ